MRRVLASVLVGLTACTTTTASSAGLVVTDIDVVNHQLVVKQCNLGMHVETETPAATAAGIALAILVIFSGGPYPGAAIGPSEEDPELALTDCRWHRSDAQRSTFHRAASQPVAARPVGAR